MKVFLCLVAGLVLYFFHALPNAWLIWYRLEIVSYPYEALEDANSFEAALAIAASSVFALVAVGWYVAKDKMAPLFVAASLALAVGAEKVLLLKADYLIVSYCLLLCVLILDTISGTETPTDKAVLRTWYKHSTVKKEFCLAAIAVLFSLSFRAQPSCYGKLGSNIIPIKINTGIVGQVDLGENHMVLIESDHIALVEKFTKKELYSSEAGQAFIVGGLGGVLSANNDHEMSLFDITDAPDEISNHQTLTSASFSTAAKDAFVLKGSLSYPSGTSTEYTMTFKHKAQNHVVFIVEQDGKDVSRTYLIQSSSASEQVFGMGVQFTHFNLKGGCVPVFTQEQGIGRGLQPISFVLNVFAKYAAGSWPITYAPVAHFISSRFRSFYLTNSEFSVFDFSRDARVAVELNGTRMEGGFCSGTNHLQVISCYAKAHAGLMVSQIHVACDL